MNRYKDDMRPGARPQPIEQQISSTRSKVRQTLLDDAPVEEKQILNDNILVSNDTNIMGGLKVVLILWAIMEYC